MSFSHPAFLWALPLAAVPLLLHLLSRRRARREPFSDLAFLRQVHARALPRTRLRRLLLAAARGLVLLLLVGAYAGPILRSDASGRGPDAAVSGGRPGEGGTGEEGLDLVVLLDVSYSMGLREGGKTRLEIARAEAEALIGGLKGSDRVAAALFSDRLEPSGGKLEWALPSEALRVLARARPQTRGTDYAPALRAAAGLLSKSGSARRKAVLILSDGARHGLRGPLPNLDPAVLWLGLEWPGTSANAFLASAGPSRESAAGAARLEVRAAGLAAGASSELDLWASGKRLQAAAVKPGAGQDSGVNLSFALPASEESAWSGRAALRPDALSADDSYFYSFRHRPRPRVLCLYGNPAFFRAPYAGYFLRELFGAGGESLLDYDADFLEAARHSQARLGDYSAVILADFAEVPKGLAAELDLYARRGGGVWVIPGGRTGEKAVEPLSPWLPARFGPLVAGEGAGVKAGAASGPLSAVWKGFELGKVVVERYFLLQVVSGAEVWLKSASDYPLLVGGRRGEGRVAVWGSALETDWSNLPVKPVFAAWVQGVLEHLAPIAERGPEVLEVKAGSPIVRAWPAKEPAPASVRVRGPDGRQTVLWLKDRRVEHVLTETPGLYDFIEQGSGRRRVYAVNLDRSTGESDLTPLKAPPWRTLKAEALRSEFALAAYGRDLRAAALGGAAALLVVEMLLALPRAAAVLLLGLLLAAPASAQQGDRLVWSQLALGETWDPYPTAPGEILELFSTVTSVLTAPGRRVLSLKDKALFSSPLVILAGRRAPAEPDAEEIKNLRDYIAAGGLLWIEDVSGTASSSFDRWARRLLSEALPESKLAAVSPEHAVFKSFFLLRGAAGRVMVRGTLEGVDWGGRTAVIYSRNDLLGAWAKDALGKPLLACTPGGEPQRHNAKKLTLNILMYALTGSYKTDAVHQPFLLQKMRSGVP